VRVCVAQVRIDLFKEPAVILCSSSGGGDLAALSPLSHVAVVRLLASAMASTGADGVQHFHRACRQTHASPAAVHTVDTTVYRDVVSAVESELLLHGAAASRSRVACRGAGDFAAAPVHVAVQADGVPRDAPLDDCSVYGVGRRVVSVEPWSSSFGMVWGLLLPLCVGSTVCSDGDAHRDTSAMERSFGVVVGAADDVVSRLLARSMPMPTQVPYRLVAHTCMQHSRHRAQCVN
jgi:hypothetical protein